MSAAGEGRLQGKAALITGGTSGIGEATAERFAQEGCRVVIAGRSVEKGEAIAERLGENVIYQQADVMREADIEAAVQRTVDEFGGLDILFNNAGGPVGGTVDDVTQEDFDHGMQLLLGSVVFGIKHAVPHMRARGGGSIINNSSIAGLRFGQGSYLYSAAKAAVTHYSKLVAVELGASNIRVNCISPGAIATPIFWGGSERANTLSDEENAKKQAKLEGNLAHATPIPSSGVAKDIADAALYLASDEARYVNAHDLVVDGGRVSMFNERSA